MSNEVNWEHLVNAAQHAAITADRAELGANVTGLQRHRASSGDFAEVTIEYGYAVGGQKLPFERRTVMYGVRGGRRVLMDSVADKAKAKAERERAEALAERNRQRALDRDTEGPIINRGGRLYLRGL